MDKISLTSSVIHEEDLNNRMSSGNNNKKFFCHYVKFKRQDISGISTLTRFDDATAFEPSEKMKCLMNISSLFSQLKISSLIRKHPHTHLS